MDFPGFDATNANIDAAHGSVRKENFHPLEVRHKTAARDSGGLDTDPARFLFQTATGDGVPDDRFLFTNGTCFHSPNTFQFQLVEIGAIPTTV